MDQYEALSYCGVFCGKCGNYKKNENCQGCRNETILIDDCGIRVCAAKRGLLHCGECADFPCAELDAFYHNGKASNLEALGNMQSIIENGIDTWLEMQKSIK